MRLDRSLASLQLLAHIPIHSTQCVSVRYWVQFARASSRFLSLYVIGLGVGVQLLAF